MAAIILGFAHTASLPPGAGMAVSDCVAFGTDMYPPSLPGFSKCGPWTRPISSIWKLVMIQILDTTADLPNQA